MAGENPYLRNFRNFRFYPILEEDRAFRKLISHPNFEKEVTEAMAIARWARKIYYRCSGDNPVFVDFGSGRGFLTVLLAFLYPKSKIVAIEKNKINTDAYNRLKNVELVKMDIFSTEVEDYLSKYAKIIMLGSHLCRDLSLRFINLYNTLSNATGSVLLPCCIGTLPDTIQLDLLRQELGNSRGKYLGWCLHLCAHYQYPVKVRIDRNILSPNNLLLISIKR